MPEGMQFVLLGVFETTLPAQALQISPQLLRRDLPAVRHKEYQVRFSRQGSKDRFKFSSVDGNNSVFLVLGFAIASAALYVNHIKVKISIFSAKLLQLTDSHTCESQCREYRHSPSFSI